MVKKEVKVDEYGLNAKERRFADEYIINGNKAGPAYKLVQPTSGMDNAYTKGGEWLRKAHILKYIKLKTKELLDASGLQANDVINRLIDIAFGRPIIGYSKQTDKLTGEIIKYIEYESTAPIEEQIRALELLGKYLSLFTDKQSVYVDTSTKIVWDIPNENE